MVCIWWSNRDGCMAVIPATAHLPAQSFQNSTVASSLLHHAGHCMTERNIPVDLFHYFTSKIKLAISYDRGWLWLATKHPFTLDPKFYQPWTWCIPEGRAVSNGRVDMCIPPPIHCSTTKNKTFPAAHVQTHRVLYIGHNTNPNTCLSGWVTAQTALNLISKAPHYSGIHAAVIIVLMSITWSAIYIWSITNQLFQKEN